MAKKRSAAAPDLFEAAQFALRYVVAGLSAGAQPEPQMLKTAHEKLFAALARAEGRS